MNLEEFAESGEVAETARALGRAFFETQDEGFRVISELYSRMPPEELGPELGREVFDQVESQPAVFGTGIVQTSAGQRPVVLVDERLVAEREGWQPGTEGDEQLASRLFSARDLASAAELLGHWGGEPGSWEIAALILPAPEPQFQPGAKVIQGANCGTLGCCVIDRQGQVGIATAGHVITGQGALVRSPTRKSRLGTVTFCSDPARVPFPASVADIAVIIPNSAPPEPGGLQINRLASALAGDLFTSFGSVSCPQHMHCAGFIDPLYLPSMAGRWASVYMTTAGRTQSGDSGGMVLSQTGDLVGHVVGGSKQYTSWIQDAEYQLAQAGAQLYA